MLSTNDEAELERLRATFFSPAALENVKAKAARVVGKKRLRPRPGDKTDSGYPGNVMSSVKKLLALGRRGEALVMLKTAVEFDAGGVNKGQPEPDGDYVGKKPPAETNEGVSCVDVLDLCEQPFAEAIDVEALGDALGDGGSAPAAACAAKRVEMEGEEKEAAPLATANLQGGAVVTADNALLDRTSNFLAAAASRPAAAACVAARRSIRARKCDSEQTAKVAKAEGVRARFLIPLAYNQQQVSVATAVKLFQAAAAAVGRAPGDALAIAAPDVGLHGDAERVRAAVLAALVAAGLQPRGVVPTHANFRRFCGGHRRAVRREAHPPAAARRGRGRHRGLLR